MTLSGNSFGRGGGYISRERSADRCARRALLWVTAGLAAVVTGVAVALRVGGPATRDAVRHLNKWVLNPLMLTVAGRRHWYAAVLNHTGRRSGRPHATPVVAVPLGDGYIIPLPYGERVDWLRNLQAGGPASVTLHGVTQEVRDPVVLDLSAVEGLDAQHRGAWERFDVDRVVRVTALAGEHDGEVGRGGRDRV
jgi:deazaflavin-dependent oxidoreductase (nitroreductase family)